MGAADFGGSREEDKHVTVALSGERALHGAGDLLLQGRGGVWGVFDLERILASGRAQYARAVEVSGDRSRVERGRHDHQAEIRPPLRALQAAEESEGEVAFEVALVEFVEDDGADAVE